MSDITEAMNHTDLASMSRDEKVEIMEQMSLKEEQIDCPVVHSFSPGIYIREVHLPAGIFAIGHYQKTEHLNIFLQGKVTVLNDDGTTQYMEAPMRFVGQPGRKCGVIHEDVVWLNIYATDETDIETLEETYLDKSDAWKSSQELVSALEDNSYVIDREDYKNALLDVGYTDDIVRNQSEDESDQIEMPHGSYKFMVSTSKIEGKGIFATAPIKSGEVVAPARIGGLRTPVGRYTNHSAKPNAEMIRSGDSIVLIAIKDINGCKGGQLGEEITTNYRDSVKLALSFGGELCQE
jgi:hypothetical protein